jgi:hypothetical protein
VSRKFAVTAPNQVWCGDVSFIWTGKRWAYLAVVIDLFARQPVGWAMSHSPDGHLTFQALTMAKPPLTACDKLLYKTLRYVTGKSLIAIRLSTQPIKAGFFF